MSALMTETEAAALDRAVWEATKGLTDMVLVRKLIQRRGEYKVAAKLELNMKAIEELLDEALALMNWEGDE